MTQAPLRLIDDVAEFYRLLAADIAGAVTSVRLEMYAYQEGEIARSLIAAMAERARRGVAGEAGGRADVRRRGGQP
ncbi:MAG: hypothetical protein HQK87_09350 [Nitrospinae bacterium]|nr:hypothetical protein [Nitrospinota bacterium]